MNDSFGGDSRQIDIIVDNMLQIDVRYNSIAFNENIISFLIIIY